MKTNFSARALGSPPPPPLGSPSPAGGSFSSSSSSSSSSQSSLARMCLSFSRSMWKEGLSATSRVQHCFIRSYTTGEQPSGASIFASGEVHLTGSLAVSCVDDASLVRPKSLTLAMCSSDTSTLRAARSRTVRPRDRR
ncbi:LOW QUALITY PROTEIN: hypothetical protein CRUP_025598 [Coryphaenoides rupestris]|nr:LOW QUALITY PROTEIN: hypothetical protein CRUP_025598 [Coryphaenoides rupestris]